ncbi:GH19616 [Drosophila grimshawi]|uniref:GH19616 n=1 Tax=Drosophila grimshawi TaxID=7222 RepID=B4K0W2_DROGR|nr:GH19616 [Drosophila grimshawi]
MVGPFMQGLLLIGIIYWYSKSMISMINDYYRNEFQRQLQSAGDSQPAAESPLSMDNFMDYVRELDTKEQPSLEELQTTSDNTNKPLTGPSHMLLYFLHITGAYKSLDFCGLRPSAADSSIS